MYKIIEQDSGIFYCTHIAIVSERSTNSDRNSFEIEVRAFYPVYPEAPQGGYIDRPHTLVSVDPSDFGLKFFDWDKEREICSYLFQYILGFGNEIILREEGTYRELPFPHTIYF
jgi:hypothetical protein